MKQIALPLDWPDDSADSGFVVDESNSSAVRHLQNWALWPVPVTVLTGPRKSGRSTLGRIFGRQTGARVIDDANLTGDEESLFHAWNTAQFEKTPLLIIADEPPPRWTIALPDLRTRMAATPKVTIDEPSDELIEARLNRHFAQRGISVSSSVADYLLRRVERSHYALYRLLELLERSALERRSGVTLSVARQALGELEGAPFD